MPAKCRQRASSTHEGLAPGEQLKRTRLPGNTSSLWGWVGTEAGSAARITSEHLLVACGLSERNNHPFCPNKHPLPHPEAPSSSPMHVVDGELVDDVIVISDDEQQTCALKGCKSNPNCLNYLGQENWEAEGA